MLPTDPRQWSSCGSYFVRLSGFSYEAVHIQSYTAPCSHVFQSCLSLRSPLLGIGELVCMLSEHLYVYLPCVTFCLFSLPFRVGR